MTRLDELKRDGIILFKDYNQIKRPENQESGLILALDRIVCFQFLSGMLCRANDPANGSYSKPSHWNRVFTMRPSLGALDTRGVVSFAP